MDQWFKDLWAKNKFFFFLLLPILILFTFRDVLLSLLIGNARKISQEAQEQDAKLKAQVQTTQVAAQEAQVQADTAQKRIDGRDESEIPEDWNKHL